MEGPALLGLDTRLALKEALTLYERGKGARFRPNNDRLLTFIEA